MGLVAEHSDAGNAARSCRDTRRDLRFVDAAQRKYRNFDGRAGEPEHVQTKWRTLTGAVENRTEYYEVSAFRFRVPHLADIMT